MDKGSDLSSKLMKVDIHPIVRDTLINQQSDLFFLRKSIMEQSLIIEQLVDNLASLVNANDAMLSKYKKLINENKRSVQADINNDE